MLSPEKLSLVATAYNQMNCVFPVHCWGHSLIGVCGHFGVTVKDACILPGLWPCLNWLWARLYWRMPICKEHKDGVHSFSKVCVLVQHERGIYHCQCQDQGSTKCAGQETLLEQFVLVFCGEGTHSTMEQGISKLGGKCMHYANCLRWPFV